MHHLITAQLFVCLRSETGLLVGRCMVGGGIGLAVLVAGSHISLRDVHMVNALQQGNECSPPVAIGRYIYYPKRKHRITKLVGSF